MRKHQMNAILHTNKPKHDTEAFFFGQLLLFHPYQNESGIESGYDSVEQHYHAAIEVIHKKAKDFNMVYDGIDKALEEYHNKTN